MNNPRVEMVRIWRDKTGTLRRVVRVCYPGSSRGTLFWETYTNGEWL